jgi:hypothetical protein
MKNQLCIRDPKSVFQIQLPVWKSRPSAGQPEAVFPLEDRVSPVTLPAKPPRSRLCLTGPVVPGNTRVLAWARANMLGGAFRTAALRQDEPFVLVAIAHVTEFAAPWNISKLGFDRAAFG